MTDSDPSAVNDTRPERLPAGPWTVTYDSDVLDVDHGGEVRWVSGIKPVVEYIDFEPGVDEEAAAHLMAAAPLMLEALKFAVANGLHPLNCTGPLHAICSCWIGQSRAAIAAAQAPEGTAL